jgi:hypothetical protein
MRNALLDLMKPPSSEATEAVVDQSQDRERAYWLALGKFIDAFAMTEIFLHFVLCHYAKVTGNVARAVFSGDRFAVVQGYLRRMSDVGVIGPKEWSDLEPLLTQLKAINDCRNTILHYGAEGIGEGRGYATNAIMALTTDRIQMFPISDQILSDMTFDLRKILIHFYNTHMGRMRWPLGSSSEAVDEILRSAWRYKLPQPSQNRPRQDSKKPKREGRRGASAPSPTRS